MALWECWSQRGGERISTSDNSICLLRHPGRNTPQPGETPSPGLLVNLSRHFAGSSGLLTQSYPASSAGETAASSAGYSGSALCLISLSWLTLALRVEISTRIFKSQCFLWTFEVALLSSEHLCRRKHLSPVRALCLRIVTVCRVFPRSACLWSQRSGNPRGSSFVILVQSEKPRTVAETAGTKGCESSAFFPTNAS